MPHGIAAFLVVGVSETQIFCHLIRGAMTQIHARAGLATVAGRVAHLVCTWCTFTCDLKRPISCGRWRLRSPLRGIARGIALVPGIGGGNVPSDMRAAPGLMGAAKIETLSDLSGQTPEAVIAMPKA